jgi:anti-sigma B factor antagonist
MGNVRSGVAMIGVRLMSERRDGLGSGRPSLTTRRTRYRHDLCVVTVDGEVDLTTAPELAEVLGEDVSPVLVVDLTRVTFLSAAGLHVLVEAAVRAQEHGRRLGLVTDGKMTLRVLRMSGTAASIPTFESLSDAVRELAPRSTSPAERDS